MTRAALLKTAAVGGLAIGMAFGTAGRARAGAWTQEPRHGYYKFATRFLRGDRFADQAGVQVDIPTVGDYTASFYGEYGLSRRLTGVLYAPFVERLTLNSLVAQPSGQEITPGATRTGVADWDLGVRIGLRQGKPTVIALGVLIGVPIGQNEDPNGLVTGDGELNQMVLVQVGHSFYPAPVYVSGEAGFNNRTRGFSDEYRYGAEVGFTFRGRTTWVLRARGVDSLRNGDDTVTGGTTGLYSNNQEYLAYGTEVIVRLGSRYALNLGVESATRERNILLGTAYTLGFSIKM